MRHPEWQERLAAVIAAAQTREFSFGGFDCCLFAAECVKAVTEVDYAERFRGEYESIVGALHILKQHGGTLESLATRVLGTDPIDVALAQPGDVVLGKPQHDLYDAFGGCIGVCIEPAWGQQRFAFPQTIGIWVYSRAVVSKAWSVG